jgi:hypothetical protein
LAKVGLRQACFEKDENLVETIRASRVAYAKPLKLAWGAQNWTLESNKHNQVKEMDVISKYHNSEIIMCNIFPYSRKKKKTLFAF